ncbi:hypothetical protein BTHE68_21090 [Burkholderia sp. THE68]|nr:hypothetical protein BTHE68_21090 [Burkholderia sp. THE68]
MQATGHATTDSFDSALASFRAGDRALAAAHCDEILSEAPGHAGANHLRGLIHLLSGDPAKAESLIRISLAQTKSAAGESDLSLALKAQKRYADAGAALQRALSLDPDFAFAHHNAARLLDEQGDVVQAETAYRRAIELKPDAADFHFNYGKLLARTRSSKAALAEFDRAVELRPAWAEAHNSRGSALGELGELKHAESAFRRALELKPDFAEARCNLGSLFVEAGRLAEAESELRTALSVDPAFAGANEALARLLSRLGRRTEAIEMFRKMVALLPDDAGALNALGATLAEEREFADAEPTLRRALELDPAFVAAHVNLGNLLMETGRSGEAETVLRRAIELDGAHWGAVYALGLLLKSARRLDEAETVSRRVVELKPRLAAGYVGLGNVLLGKASGDIGEALNNYRHAIKVDPDCLIGHSNLAFTLNFESSNGLDVLEEARRFAAHFEAPYATGPMKYTNDSDPSRRLRIGYVSPDFRNHCQAMFLLPLLRHHDHEAVEVYCYSSVSKPDDVTREIAGLSDVWRDVHKLDDDQLASQIREDRIDVLVDLTMHMSNGRPQLYARRPAPVQVAWLAYPGTTGSSAIGYRLTDPWIDPPGSPEADERYTEQSIRLPDTFWCYDPMTADLESGPLPADGAGHVMFGCLNNPCKLSDRTFELWSRVMSQVAGSRLTLLVSQGQAREAIIARFAALGIDAGRLSLVDYQPRETYLRTYQQIDIVLDTFPYNGHTTSLDGLWMGVPVVTMIGETAAARAGYAFLSNLGLPELAGDSEECFVTEAVGLASDLPRLRELRSGLRARMERSPLMDGARFARGMEKAFRSMWAGWVSGTAPRAEVRPKARKARSRI